MLKKRLLFLLYKLIVNIPIKMSVKIDTKEKFTVITPELSTLSANMTGDLQKIFEGNLEKSPPHVVLDLTNVQEIDDSVAALIASIQAAYYAENNSFVICCLQKNVQLAFEQSDLIDSMNITPTQSEAWDIVQMEEVERELLNGFDD